MGDLIGKTVEGTLYFVPKVELDRVRELNVEAPEKVGLFADLCRINALYMIAKAGSGHIGSCFSCLDIVSWLHLQEMRDGEVYFSSKGHDAPALYAVLTALGQLDFDQVHRLRQVDGLPGHPDIGTPHIVTNTGSLGMGISKAKGMVRANRHLGKEGRVFVLTGDGELQEGQIWESLVGAANDRLHEIVTIVDHNKLQSDRLVSQTSDLGDLEAKFRSFGWEVARVDGHDVAAFARTLSGLRNSPLPKLILADTVKGCGVSFMEHTAMESDAALYRFHSGAPDADSYTRAAQELLDRVNQRCDAIQTDRIAFDTIESPRRPPPGPQQKLVAAYADALVEQGEKNERLMVLDADLMIDMGQKPFADRFPKRFIECGIAEMDMVSQAGGMALNGCLPVCHSFACFLSTRPNEHIYNNATELTKVVYVAGLAGVVPGGPGHSHQSVRDISALGAVPGLVMAEPCTEREVGMLFDWCINGSTESAYLRLVNVPWEVPFTLPDGYGVAPGRGVVVREGADVVVIGYGPVLLSEAWHAAEALANDDVSVRLVNLPWLNRVDADWLQEVCKGAKRVVTLDNHYIDGGQGDFICAAAATSGLNLPVHKVGLREVPVSGSNHDVLRHHGLDRDCLRSAIVGGK